MDIFFKNKVDWIKDVEVLANIQPPTIPHLLFPLLPELLKEDELNPLITPPPSTPGQYPSILN